MLWSAMSAIVCLGLQYCTFGTFGTFGTLGTFGTFGTCILGILGYLHTCFGLPWSTLIYLGLLGLFQIIIERLKCSKAISGRDGMGLKISVGTDSKSTALRC